MKITPQQWIEVVKLVSTFIIGLITALCIQSCTASMSVFEICCTMAATMIIINMIT